MPVRPSGFIGAAWFLAAALGATGAQGAGDPGQAVFARCAVCHALEPGVNRLGPSLDGIVGRKAGALAGFRYSPAMKASGLTWTPENLDRFIAAPHAVIPGTNMAFADVSQPEDRADLLAYLVKSAGGRR